MIRYINATSVTETSESYKHYQLRGEGRAVLTTSQSHEVPSRTAYPNKFTVFVTTYYHFVGTITLSIQL